MKKIIVPVDFSEHSEYALQAAAMLAKKFDSEILVLHMLEMSDSLLPDPDHLQDSKTAFLYSLAEKKFKEFLRKDYLTGIGITPMIKHFRVFSEISELALDHSVDLIVMGSHGTAADRSYFTGSNTEKVVRKSEVPVLVVKKRLEHVDFKNAIFVNNFDEESVSSYRKAKQLIEQLGAKLHLLYVNIPGSGFKNTDAMEKKVNDFLQASGEDSTHRKVNYISDYTVEEGVFNFARRINSDLIAIPTHGRTGLSQVFRGSITEDIANHSTLPVLTFKIE